MLLEKYLLAPGDIFWHKKSGKTVLLSKKGELVNFHLIKKLEANREKIIIEDFINFEMQKLFQKNFKEMKAELQVKEKIAIREKIIGRLSSYFLDEDTQQLELNLLAWSLFSNFNLNESLEFMNLDTEIFNRHLSVASNYVFCALMLGYYDSHFLTHLFNKTLRNLVTIGKRAEIVPTKEKLESINLKDTFNVIDLEEMRNLENSEKILFSGFFERYDGTGVSGTNIREMIDLEVVLIAINRHFHFCKKIEGNFFKIIVNNEFNCDQKLNALIKKTLLERDQGIVQVIGLG